MHNIILNFGKQFAAGFDAAKDTGKEFKNRKFDAIFVCGMGGSALPGELLKLLETGLPVKIHKNYSLPYGVNKNSLIVFISYSGNTEETLSSFKIIAGKNFSAASITSGGELEKISKENKIPVAIVPKGIAPRMALGYQFSALLKILENSGIIKNTEKEFLEAINKLDTETLEIEGKSLSEKIEGKIPLIYSSKEYFPLAYILKILLNENVKISAFANFFPELCHNEIQAFRFPDERFTVLILKDEGESGSRMEKAMAASAEIMSENGFPVNFLTIRKTGESIFEAIIKNLTLFYWTTYFLAKSKGVEPLENSLIDEFKAKLRG